MVHDPSLYRGGDQVVYEDAPTVLAELIDPMLAAMGQ